MNKLSTKIIAPFLLLSIYGCAGGPGETTGTPKDEQPNEVAEEQHVDYVESLPSTSWQLSDSQYDPRKMILPSFSINPKDGGLQITGRSGCNSFSASLRVTGNIIEPIKEIQGSKTLCPSASMKLEKKLYSSMHRGGKILSLQEIAFGDYTFTKIK